jgi:hypothetical protein
MSQKLSALVLLLSVASIGQAQIDTVNTSSNSLNRQAFHDQQHTYAVYWEDSLGNILSTPDLWKRSLTASKSANATPIFIFEWQWFKQDSLYAHIRASGELASMKPIWHHANYFKRGKFTVAYANNEVSIPDSAQRHPRHRDFKVVLNYPAFEFPMDMEIFALLPYKKIGQQFAMAFYEPGSKASNYYKLTVTGKEKLLLQGATTIQCWLLRIDYAPDSYATFWIADKPREVVKMKEYYQGKYRYKIKLF